MDTTATQVFSHSFSKRPVCPPFFCRMLRLFTLLGPIRIPLQQLSCEVCSSFRVPSARLGTHEASAEKEREKKREKKKVLPLERGWTKFLTGGLQWVRTEEQEQSDGGSVGQIIKLEGPWFASRQ